MSDNPRLDDLLDRWEEAQESGTPIAPEELCRTCPELLPELCDLIRQMAWVDDAMGTTSNADPDATEKFEIPKTLGRYRLEQLIGEGGFGQVWKSFDPQLERNVAIKVLRPDGQGSALQGTRFLDEARKVARLKHPNIVPVHDAGQDQGLYYIVSDLIDGSNLSQLIGSETINTDEALRIVAKVADALHHGHEQGVIHRDIKPHNILVDATREPFVTDFGIAVTEAEIESDTVYTAGTPAYMAPEQAVPHGPPLDCRCDIYSLGVVLYELLVGAAPYTGKTVAALRSAHQRSRPQLPKERVPSISDALDAVCMRALEIDPCMRWDSARQFANAIRESCQPAATTPGGHGETATSAATDTTRRAATTTASNVNEPARRASSQVAILSLGGLAAVVALGLLAGNRGGIEKPTPPDPPSVQANAAAADNPGEAIAPPDNPGEAIVQPGNPGEAIVPPDNPGEATVQPVVDRPPLQSFHGLIETVNSCEFSPDGKYVIATGSREHGIVWDKSTGVEVCRINHNCRYAYFTSDEEVVTIGREEKDGVARWSFPGGQLLTKHDFRGCRQKAARSPDRDLAIYTTDSTPSVFDLASGEDVWELPTKTQAFCVDISQDGTLALTGESCGAATLWSIPRQEEIREFTRSGHEIQACAISSDNRLAVVASGSNTTGVFDIESGQVVRSHSNTIHPRSAAFSADGRLYAVGCEGRILIWEATTGNQFATIKAHGKQYVTSLRFSDDGSQILSGGGDGMVHLWQLPPE